MYNASNVFLYEVYAAARRIEVKVLIDDQTYTGASVKTLALEESVNSGDDLTVGSCCASSLDITILNADGVLNDKNLAGKTVKPYIGLQLTDFVEYIPLGVFTVADAVKKNGYSLTLKAYDRMTIMDQAYDPSTISYPCTLMALLTDLCTQAGIELINTTIPNGDMVLQEGFFGMDLTCRAMLTYIAQAAGCFARFDRLGKLELAWYTDSGVSITADNYMTATIAEHTMPMITKLTIRTEEGDLGVSVGDGDDEYSIVGNPILYANPTAALQGIYGNISGMEYTPMEVVAQGNPALQAGDLITLTTLDNQIYQVPIMTHKIEYNGGVKSTIAAVGKSETDVTPRGTVNAKIIALQKQANVLNRTLTETISRIENTETDLATVNSNITELRQTANSIAATVEDTANELDRVSGEMTELENRTAELELSTAEFKVEVSETYVTKTEVEQIQVGGRNLALNTASEYTGTASNANGSSTWEDAEHKKWWRHGIAIEPDTQYVVSFNYTLDWSNTEYSDNIPTDGSIGVGIGTGSTPGNYEIDTWAVVASFVEYGNGNISGRFVYVLEPKTQANLAQYPYFAFRPLRTRADYTGIKITISNFQLERGNKVTDWSPSPEDMTKSITDAVDAVQVGGRNLLLGTSVPVYIQMTEAFSARDTTQKYDYSPIITDDPKAFLLSIRDGYLLFSYDANIPAIYQNSAITSNRVGAYFTFQLTDKTTNAVTTWYGTHTTPGVATKKHTYPSTNSLRPISSQSADSPNSFAGHYSCYLKMSEVSELEDFYANPDNYDITVQQAVANIRGMSTGGYIKNLQLLTGQYETDWTLAPEDTNEAINEAMTTVIERTSAALDIANDNILSTVASEYSKKSELEEVRQYTDTKVQQTADSITYTFSTVQEALDLLDGKVDQNKLDLEEYIRFAGALIELGKRGSPFVAKLDNTKLAFLQDGREIAYISNNTLNITDAIIKGKLTMTMVGGFFDWVPEQNGSMSLVWRDA